MRLHRIILSSAILLLSWVSAASSAAMENAPLVEARDKIESAGSAIERLEESARVNGADPRRMLELSIQYRALGQGLSVLGEKNAALTALDTSLSIAKKLVAGIPESTEYQLNLADALFAQAWDAAVSRPIRDGWLTYGGEVIAVVAGLRHKAMSDVALRGELVERLRYVFTLCENIAEVCSSLSMQAISAIGALADDAIEDQALQLKYVEMLQGYALFHGIGDSSSGAIDMLEQSITLASRIADASKQKNRLVQGHVILALVATYGNREAEVRRHIEDAAAVLETFAAAGVINDDDRRCLAAIRTDKDNVVSLIDVCLNLGPKIAKAP